MTYGVGGLGEDYRKQRRMDRERYDALAKKARNCELEESERKELADLEEILKGYSLQHMP